jgi:hypothetical protein
MYLRLHRMAFACMLVWLVKAGISAVAYQLFTESECYFGFRCSQIGTACHCSSCCWLPAP